MKDINNIKITRIATFLQTLPNNNVVGGEPGIALVHAEQMHNFGKELMEILADEMGRGRKENEKGQNELMKYKIGFLDLPGNYRKQEDIELPDGVIPLSTEVRARLGDTDLPFHIWINDPHKGYKYYTRIYYLIKKEHR